MTAETARPFGQTIEQGTTFGHGADLDDVCVGGCGRTYADLPQGQFMTQSASGPNKCSHCLNRDEGRVL